MNSTCLSCAKLFYIDRFGHNIPESSNIIKHLTTTDFKSTAPPRTLDAEYRKSWKQLQRDDKRGDRERPQTLGC
jgi:hypothetical protein